MIARASGLGLGVARLPRRMREVGVLAMPDAGLDPTRLNGSVCEVLLGAGVLRLLEPGVVVGVIGHCHSIADGVISAMRELFSEDEGVEF